MKLPTAKLGYMGAGATVLVAILVPFLLTGMFTGAFAGMGLQVDEMYSGGPVVRTISMAGYSVDVHRLVKPHMLQREQPFVQLDWKPLSALPSRVEQDVDIDGDGKQDVRVSFDAPRDPKAQLRADVIALSPAYGTQKNMGKQKFSSLIVRLDDAIVVRVPLVKR